MITQGIDAGTGETVGLDAAGTKARSAQADAPKSLNSPTITTQGEALEARARELLAVEYAREGHLAYALEIKRGNLNRVGMGPSIRAIIAALQPNIDHAVGGVRADTCPTCGRTKYDPDAIICSSAFHLSAPQQPVNLDAVRGASLREQLRGPVWNCRDGAIEVDEALDEIERKIAAAITKARGEQA